jgi:hypothetical protein
VSVVNNSFINTVGDSILINSQTPGWNIQGNICKGGLRGIWVNTNCHPFTTISDNYMQDNTTAGIVVANVDGGIVFPYATNNTCVVEGNRIVNPTGMVTAINASTLNPNGSKASETVQYDGTMPLLQRASAGLTAIGNMGAFYVRDTATTTPGFFDDAGAYHTLQYTSYTPAVGANWVDPDPTTLVDAINRLAARLVTVGGAPIP